MANNIGANVRVTGDFGDLEIKLNGVVKAFGQSAKEAKKASDVMRDAFGRQVIKVDGVERIVEGLAKWRREAGMYVDEAGRIRDKNDHLVEGLTTLQQKLGMYVDDLGNVRKANGELADSLIEVKKGTDGLAHSYDANGNLVDGLERWRVEMGQYIDDLGRVTDAYGRFFDGLSNAQIKGRLFADEEGNIRKIGDESKKIIDQTKEAKERARELEEEWDDIRSSVSDGFRGLGDVVSQITGNIAELGGPNAQKLVEIGNIISGALSGAQSAINFADALKDAREAVVAMGEGAKAGILTLKRYKDGFYEAWDAAKKAKSMMVFFQMLPAGLMPLTAVLGGVAAALGAWYFTAKAAKEVKLSEDFKQLAEEAAKAGKSISSLGDALQTTTFKHDRDIRDIITDYVEATKRYKKAKNELEAANRDAMRRQETLATYGTSYQLPGMAYHLETKKARDKFEIASNERSNIIAEFNKVASDFVKRAVDSMTTEEERLLKEMEMAEIILKEWEAQKGRMKPEELAATQEKEKKLRDYLAKLNEDLAKVRAGEVDAAEDAANAERERAERLRKSGISSYMDQTDIPKITAESYKGVTEQWNKLVDEGLVTQEQLNDALKRAKDVALDDLLNKLGVELPKATDELMDEFGLIAKALEDNLITSEQAEQARKAVQTKNTDDLVSQLGLDVKKSTDKDMFDVIKEAFATDKYDLSRQAEILGAAYEKRAEELAQEQGIEFGESVSNLMKAQESYADKIRKWQEEFEAGHVTDKQLQDAKAALAKQYADEVAKRTGVDLSADATPKTKAESILADLEEKRGQWLEYLQTEGADLSVFDKAMEQLNAQAKAAMTATFPATEKVKTTTEKYASMMDDLKKAHEAGLYSDEEYARMQKDINNAKRKELEAATSAAKSRLGLDRLQEEAEAIAKGGRTWRDDLEKQRRAIIEAAKKGEIAENDKTKALNNLNTIIKAREKQEREEAKKKKAEEAKRIRDDARSSLNVDSIMESLKSPLQKFQETMAKLNANKAFVSMEEYAAVWQNAVKEYQEASKAVGADSAIEEMKSGKAKTTAGTSIQAGSSDLYKALIARQAPTAWESTMQTTTKQIHSTQEEGNLIAQENNLYLQQMVMLMQQGNGGVAVFG